ncbi:MAG: hypothetical protein HW377_2124 [Actinobacteria bacterium]|nr:hypothetical protein [Actinomycetota bacterium]
MNASVPTSSAGKGLGRNLSDLDRLPTEGRYAAQGLVGPAQRLRRQEPFRHKAFGECRAFRARKGEQRLLIARGDRK